LGGDPTTTHKNTLGWLGYLSMSALAISRESRILPGYMGVLEIHL
jgi:hypothetical protein